jgi:hypothetical protein
MRPPFLLLKIAEEPFGLLEQIDVIATHTFPKKQGMLLHDAKPKLVFSKGALNKHSFWKRLWWSCKMFWWQKHGSRSVFRKLPLHVRLIPHLVSPLDLDRLMHDMWRFWIGAYPSDKGLFLLGEKRAGKTTESHGSIKDRKPRRPRCGLSGWGRRSFWFNGIDPMRHQLAAVASSMPAASLTLVARISHTKSFHFVNSNSNPQRSKIRASVPRVG